MVPGIGRVAFDGWRLTRDAFVAMPRLMGSGLGGFLVAQHAIGQWIGPMVAGPKAVWTLLLLGILSRVVDNLIHASVLIGIHRFIITGEVIDRAVWVVPPMYGRFVVWAIGLSLAMTPASIIQMLIGARYPGLSVTISGVYAIGVLFVSMRLMLMLPALALNARFEDWRRVWEISRGHVWRFMFCGLLALLPLIAVIMVVTISVMSGQDMKDPHFGLGTELFLNTLGMLMVCLGGAVASRLFQIHAAPAAPGLATVGAA